MAGIGLGISGCVMQAVLKNPLASPFTLGLSSGAGFGVSVAIVLNFGLFGGMWLIIGNTFFFCLTVFGFHHWLVSY
jgi:iron complex transport system permease protein